MPLPRRLPPEALIPYLLDVPHPRKDFAVVNVDVPPQPIPWHQIFGNDRPVEIEVGFGKGLFLLNQSQDRPEVNFLGIEIEPPLVKLTADRLARREISNVRVACTDARWYFKQRVVAGSVAAVHVYFPDPWWKRCHHKRRVMTPEFLLEIDRVLRPDGLLHFVSDVQAYFDSTLKIIAKQARLQPVPPPEVKDAKSDEDYLTNFERKYRVEGRPIYRSSFQKMAQKP